MRTFRYTVEVDCESAAEAQRVMAERLGPDEDYGFDYTVSYRRAPESLTCEVCGDSEYTGTRWPVEINGDASHAWVEKCDQCDLYADDMEAALYIAAQEGRTVTVARPRGSSDWQPVVEVAGAA